MPLVFDGRNEVMSYHAGIVRTWIVLVALQIVCAAQAPKAPVVKNKNPPVKRVVAAVDPPVDPLAWGRARERDTPGVTQPLQFLP